MTTAAHAEWARILRNGGLNLAGNVLPLLVGVATMPMTIRGIGVEAFGVLAFAWAILGYFTLFDLGLSRATTKFVAELLGERAPERVPAVVWTSVALSAALAAVGGIVIAAGSHPLVTSGLKIAPALQGDARRAFVLLAVGLPAVLISNVFKGVLEADQRFGLVNLVKIPASAAIFALPAIGSAVGLRLPGITALLVLSRAASTIAYGCLCIAVFPSLRRIAIERGAIRPLLTYGGWVTVSNLLGPILTYADRFAIGALLSTTAVAYYTAPYEVVTRLWIFPASIVAALFPAFSSAAARDSHDSIGRFCRRSIAYLLAMMGPLVVAAVLLARPILTLWLGHDFAARGTVVFQLLAIGVLINSLTQVPFTLLQALDRADLPAKFYVAELAVYLPLVALLIGRFGIVGAAAAWTIRVALDGLLHFGASLKLYPTAWAGGPRPAVRLSRAYTNVE